LISEVRPDQASFFMLSTLPGSRDHKRMIQDGSPMEACFASGPLFCGSAAAFVKRGAAWPSSGLGCAVSSARTESGESSLREIRLAAGFLMALMPAGPIGKANPEHRSSEPTLAICPVPSADTGG
jgi:hypothetical protein